MIGQCDQPEEGRKIGPENWRWKLIAILCALGAIQVVDIIWWLIIHVTITITQG